MHRPRTSIEIKRSNIKKLIKKVERREMTPKEAEINRRLAYLADINDPWYDELQAKYISVVKKLNDAF